jgi:hypothetical protein
MLPVLVEFVNENVIPELNEAASIIVELVVKRIFTVCDDVEPVIARLITVII